MALLEWFLTLVLHGNVASEVPAESSVLRTKYTSVLPHPYIAFVVWERSANMSSNPSACWHFLIVAHGLHAGARSPLQPGSHGHLSLIVAYLLPSHANEKGTIHSQLISSSSRLSFYSDQRVLRMDSEAEAGVSGVQVVFFQSGGDHHAEVPRLGSHSRVVKLSFAQAPQAQ